MAAQNIYDDPDFHARYMTLDRQVRGRAGAAEWPVLCSMLPTIEAKTVVDLGCGAGWFSRFAADHGAASVLGKNDLVFSSLTLHYVKDLDHLLSLVAASLVPGGSLVFSVEHPIYSAPTTQEFATSVDGVVKQAPTGCGLCEQRDRRWARARSDHRMGPNGRRRRSSARAGRRPTPPMVSAGTSHSGPDRLRTFSSSAVR